MTTYTSSAITITDTGKRRTTSASAEETDLANSGSAIALAGLQVTLDEACLLNTNPSLSKLTTPSDGGSKFKIGEVDSIGINIPKWTLVGILDLNVSADRALLQHLRDLTRTKGYKTLSGDLPDLIDGSDDSSTVNVRLQSVKISQRAKSNVIDFTISMFETA